MDVPGATRWSPDQVVSRDQMLEEISRRFGSITPVAETSSAPARATRCPTARFSASSLRPPRRFAHLRRSRLTADGMWYRLPYATQGTDLRGPLGAGLSAEI